MYRLNNWPKKKKKSQSQEWGLKSTISFLNCFNDLTLGRNDLNTNCRQTILRQDALQISGVTTQVIFDNIKLINNLKIMREFKMPNYAKGLPKWLQWERIHLPKQETQRYGFDPWVRKIPWKKKWQPIPVFLPGESHGQRSLIGPLSTGSQRVGPN